MSKHTKFELMETCTYTCEPKAVEWGVDKRNENKLRDKNKKGFILWK